MPVLAVPVLTSAATYGGTTGHATATAPRGVTYTQWTFIATPVGGGAAVTATGPTPYVRFDRLNPGTQYTISVVGTTANGQKSPASDTVQVTTPSTG